MKLKPLTPVLKEKKRYISFHILCEQSLSKADVHEAIMSAATQWMGVVGVSAYGVRLISYSRNKGIVRVAHNGVDQLIAALSTIESIGKPCIILTDKTSGIIGKVKQ